MNPMDRRHFIKSSFAGASLSLLSSSPLKGLTPEACPPHGDQKNPITRRLGNSGIELPVVSM
ncbi:MAG TPA: hypothetical protein VK569_03540, partial [Bacteroidota bacterium]|nr:hypothetical protein [Bacteroidota bacterium]